MIKFGPSGFCEDFAKENKSTEDMPKWLLKHNLSCYELSFTNGVRLSLETAEKLIDAKAFSDAMTQVLNGLNETKVQMLFRQMVLSGIDVPEAEVAEFLTSGKIPASLKLKNPTPKEISAIYNKVIANAKKIKAEILKGAKEPEPGDE